MTKTSEFCSIHQKDTCKSCLQLNLIILTDFHSVTANEDKLQKFVNFLDFWLGPGRRFMSKLEIDYNFLILYHSSAKDFQMIFEIEFDHFD